MKRLLLLLAIVAPLAINAQTRTEVGINFTMALPTGEMHSETEATTGFGGGAYVFVRPVENIPIFLGIDFNYTNYGRYREFIPNPISPFASAQYEQIINSNILMGHVGLRISPIANVSPIRPYVDGLIGGKFLFTRWRLVEEIDNGIDPIQRNAIEANTDASDFAFSYGAAAGIHVAFGKHFGIDVRCSYLFGTEAEYVESFEFVNGVNPEAGIEYNLRRTETSMIVPQLGVVLMF